MQKNCLTDEFLQDRCTMLKPAIQSLQNYKPAWSVIFCAHNEEKYLLPTIESISKIKTSLSIEIIAVNNASSDRTREILEQSWIRVIDEKIKWISYARNAWLEAARWEIIFQTDADTKVPSTWIDAHNMNYRENISWVAGNITFEWVHFLYYLYRIGAITFHIFLDIIGRWPKCTWWANLSYRKSDAIKAWWFHRWSDLWEDVLLFQKLSELWWTKVIKSDEIAVKTNWRRFNDLEKTKKHIYLKFSTILERLNANQAIALNKSFEDIR